MDDKDDKSLVCFYFYFMYILLTLFYSYALKCGRDRKKGPKQQSTIAWA
jgi:hypothetical protein